PDIILIHKERATFYNPQTGALIGVPDLVVEVISLTHQARDRITKFAEYEKAGVAWLWLVDAFSLAVGEYQLEGGRYVRAAGVLKGEVFRPKLFSGLEIDLGALVGEPPKVG
ncbi:MAG: Uma2 family endonuclease, partial [Candidatus Methylomirabilales bacterium]